MVTVDDRQSGVHSIANMCDGPKPWGTPKPMSEKGERGGKVTSLKTKCKNLKGTEVNNSYVQLRSNQWT